MLDRFRTVFRLVIADGKLRVERGNPRPAFVRDCEDIVRLHGIRQGTIDCLGQGRHARLRFSKEFPQRGRQAVRNAWTPPVGPGPGGGKRRRS